MSVTLSSKCFKMTLKTRLFLWLHGRFSAIEQWFIRNCDYEICDYKGITEVLIEDSQFELLEEG